MSNYIGIDNGLDGGIVMLDSHGGLRRAEMMPTETHGKKRRVSVRDFLALLNEMMELTNDKAVVLYEVPSGCQSAAAGISMQDSFARIETTLMITLTTRIPVIANDWQKTFWRKPKMPKGQSFDTKAAALKVARELWPTREWLATERSKKPHNGMIDAALIAEYGRRSGF